jgi:hypothetical protein
MILVPFRCRLKKVCKGRSGDLFLAASTECSAGSNDHFVVGVGGGGGHATSQRNNHATLQRNLAKIRIVMLLLIC